MPEYTGHSPAGGAETGVLPDYGPQGDSCRIFGFISASEAVCHLVYNIFRYTAFG